MPDKNRARSLNLIFEGMTYAGILGLCVVAYLGLTRNALSRAEEVQTDMLYREQAMISTRLQQAMNKKLFFARGMAGAVSLSPDVSQSEFSDLCAAIKTEDSSIVNMALVTGTVITHVHPYAENNAFLGSDLSKKPEQLRALRTVEETGKTLVEGPTQLFQGYPGFIVREPVYAAVIGKDQGDLIGVASIVFALQPFLEEVGFDHVTETYNLAVGVSHDTSAPALLMGQEETLDTARAIQEVSFPGITWTVAMSPKEAAAVPTKTLSMIRLNVLIGGLLALLAARYLHALRRRNWRIAMQLRAALNAAPSGFVMFDKDDRLELCNKRYIELHGDVSDAIQAGASLETILRAGVEAGLYPDAAGQEEAWIAAHLSRELKKGTGHTIALRNGSWIQLLEHETPEGGRVAILNDITEVQCSRERAKLAEQRLFDAINALPVGFWLFDKEDKLLMFNTVAGEKFSGVKRNLMTGRPLEDLILRRLEISDEVRLNGCVTQEADDILAALRGETSELEVRYDGDRWFKYFSRRTSEGGLVMFRVEISDLRRHQRELEASNAELRAALFERDEAEARLQDVADLSAEWFWEQDAEMRLISVSEGFERSMGIDPEKLIGTRRDEFFSGEEYGQEDTIRQIFRAMQAHEPFHDIVYSYHFKPDVLSWVRVSGKPLFNAEGEFTGYIGIAEDVTKFYAALREAEQADEAKTQFLNIISHELRTPLSAVLGFNSFIANFEKLPSYAALKEAMASGEVARIEPAQSAFEAEITRFTSRIQAAGTQLKSLIDDMLDLARIEANTLRIHPQRVDSQKVAVSVVEQMHTLADEKGLDVRLDLSASDVRADEIRFRQILTNLLGNAYKFTDEGHVTLRSHVEDGMVIFEVEDTGIGIAPDRLGIIFDRFAQVASGTNRKNQGVGLGLAICKDLAAAQNGWIRVESEVGVGTKMIFAIPLWSEDEVDRIEQAPPKAS